MLEGTTEDRCLDELNLKIQNLHVTFSYMIEKLIPLAKKLKLTLVRRVKNDIKFNFKQDSIWTPSGRQFEVIDIILSENTLTRVLYDYITDH